MGALGHRERILLATAAVWMIACGGASAPPPHAAETAESSSAATSQDRDLSPSEIAERATPSVVSIKSDDSIGTGFVVKKDGWIATNLHVIASGSQVAVFTADGKRFDVVEVLAVDSDRDLALVRIDSSDLPELTVGDSDRVRPGDAVIAIGHPLGLEDTVSDGLISAVRKIDETLTLLQISAPIAPGSSGGPLIDHRGRVIGVATAVSQAGQNLNFGVPTRYLRELMASDEKPMTWSEFTKTLEAPELPSIKRNVPKHPDRLLKGCGEGDLRLLAAMIGEAIDTGAPLYNGGNFAGCYHVYEGAAADAERRLGAGCGGPKRALAAGRAKAAKLSDPAAQAWAMRDAFDGLMVVIERKLGL